MTLKKFLEVLHQLVGKADSSGRGETFPGEATICERAMHSGQYPGMLSQQNTKGTKGKVKDEGYKGKGDEYDEGDKYESKGSKGKKGVQELPKRKRKATEAN